MTAQKPLASPRESRRLFLFVLALFILSSVLRGIEYAHGYFLQIYPDALRYLEIAKSIWHGRGIQVYNAPSSYQKILYSLFLAPFYAIRDSALRVRAMHIGNAILMSSAFFPAYLLGRRLTKNSLAIALSLLILFISPIFGYVGNYMSEVLYLPMGLWNIYLVVLVWQSRGFRKKCILAFCAGVFTYLSYLAKEIAVVFLLSYAVLACYQWLWDIPRRPKKLLPAALMFLGFALCFLIMKLTLFRGEGNSYAHQITLEQIATPYRVFYMFYSFVVGGSLLMLNFFIFPLLYPMFRFQNLRGRDDGDIRKKTYLFLMLCFLITLASVAYTIYVREDLGYMTPRTLSRYYIPLLFPFTLLFFDLVLDKPRRLTPPGVAQGKLWYLKWALAGAVVLLLFVLLDPRMYVGFEYDLASIIAVVVWSFGNVTEGQGDYYYNTGMLLVKCAIAVYLAYGLYQLLRANAKRAALFFTACMVGLNLLVDCNVLLQNYDRWTQLEPEEAALVELDSYLQNHDGEVLVVVVTRDANQGKFEAYLTEENYEVELPWLLGQGSAKGYLDLTTDALHVASSLIPLDLTLSFYPPISYDYIVSYEDLPFTTDCLTEIPLEHTGYCHLYQINGTRLVLTDDAL